MKTSGNNGEIDNRSMLERELREWADAGMRPRLFLRDDDAIDVTPALLRLCEAVEYWNIPLLLAAIPKFVTSELEKFVIGHPLVKPAVHGFAHANHARSDEKKIELGDHRAAGVVIDELVAGREKLQEMFGEKLSHLLVPPWNRIGRRVASRVVEAGFSAISGFGWKKPQTGPPRVNTHVDIIDWKNGKAAKSFDDAAGELSLNLKTARQNKFAPVGILTHHLVHDEQCWSVLDELFHLLGESDQVGWVVADDLIGPQKSL